MENNKPMNAGQLFVVLLQIIFISLKLSKVITWKWWLVLLPIEIEAGIVIICSIIIFIVWLVEKSRY